MTWYEYFMKARVKLNYFVRMLEREVFDLYRA